MKAIARRAPTFAPCAGLAVIAGCCRIVRRAAQTGAQVHRHRRRRVPSPRLRRHPPPLRPPALPTGAMRRRRRAPGAGAWKAAGRAQVLAPAVSLPARHPELQSPGQPRIEIARGSRSVTAEPRHRDADRDHRPKAAVEQRSRAGPARLPLVVALPRARSLARRHGLSAAGVSRSKPPACRRCICQAGRKWRGWLRIAVGWSAGDTGPKRPILTPKKIIASLVVLRAYDSHAMSRRVGIHRPPRLVGKRRSLGSTARKEVTDVSWFSREVGNPQSREHYR